MSVRNVALVALLIVCCMPLHASAQSQKAAYLQYVEDAAEAGWAAYPDVIARWKANVNPSVLWGYNSPSQPIYLADILGFLYQETGESHYAERAAQILGAYGDLRDAYPADYAASRAEYDDGIPALANFFFLPPYSRAYQQIRDSGVLDAPTRQKIEQELAHSLDFVFHFPEWGAHNRAMLRAEGLYYGYRALPDHPHADRWKQMAETLAFDNLHQWEAEDATIYHPIWLNALFSYAAISERPALYDSPLLRYYAEYFKQLFTPARTMPDIGDAAWNPQPAPYIAAFEQFAAQYEDPELKWIAERMFEQFAARPGPPGVGAASALAQAYRWTDDALAPRAPTSTSQEVLDDIVGKKVVFRSGWAPDDTYLLLNYRDEGEGGFATREFLRHTITVEEEKMHHGSSDGNSIALLMDDGDVLLHDAGYRSGLPSGPYGAYRADYYHNRLVVRKNKRDRHQSVAAFVRNSGAHRPVRTQKVDFLPFEEVDMSRTRLADDKMGYTWDRIVTYVKPEGFFLVVDAVEVNVEDYYTFTNFWHTQHLHDQGAHYYDTAIDSIESVALPQDKRLLVQFLDNTAKTDSFFVQDRHGQEEHAIYQTKASHYRVGDYEVFVTALFPHDGSAPAASYLDKVRVLPTARYPEAIGFEIDRGTTTSYLGLKLDLASEVVRENIRPRYTWETGRTQYGPFETDAHFLFATVGADSVRYAASQVLRVHYEDTVLMEALPNTHGLQPDGSPDRVGYVKWRFWEDAVEAND